MMLNLQQIYCKFVPNMIYQRQTLIMVRKFYTLLSYQITSSLDYTTFVWRSIVKGMSCDFLWQMHCPYSSSLWPAQAEEKSVPFLKSLVWPGLEPDTSPSRSGCDTTSQICWVIIFLIVVVLYLITKKCCVRFNILLRKPILICIVLSFQNNLTYNLYVYSISIYLGVYWVQFKQKRRNLKIRICSYRYIIELKRMFKLYMLT